MNAAPRPPLLKHWREALRWGACFVLVLGFHAAGAAVLLARWNDGPEAIADAPVITVELTAEPAAPATTPNEMPPGPLQASAQPEPEPERPVEKVELPPAPQPDPPLQAAPPPKPIKPPSENKRKQKQAGLATAPSPAPHRALRVTAATPGAASRDPDAMSSWKSRLVAQIERFKRYPADARGESGLAEVTFSVDRSGGVHRKHIVRSSGSSALDHDALAWVERAQPLPPPPRDMSGEMISITVPLRYNYR